MSKRAIIIGAGPAGLTAAYELLKHVDSSIKPIVFERSNEIGGISRTVKYKGNCIDIGGHRFFSKSDRVMQWWQEVLPLETPSTKKEDKEVMLLRNRLSRIFYNRKFFSYPIKLSLQTLKNLGLAKVIKIGLTYTLAKLFPKKDERYLREFLINRFGKELYETFFKDYTEKVWGVPCSKISAEWGGQRIKGLSISKVIIHAIKSLFASKKSIAQKDVETSLISGFMYPKFGPGQLWEKVAEDIKSSGGEVILEHDVIRVNYKDDKILSVDILDRQTNTQKTLDCDYLISTMPVRNLMTAMNAPSEVRAISDDLHYRDFMTVGILVDKVKIKSSDGGLIKDNWIYIQESDVSLGRLQIFNNWSPYLVRDESKVWLGLEYFCNEGDHLWSMTGDNFKNFAADELIKIGIVDRADILDSILIKVPKAYPAYWGSYSKFDQIKDFTNGIENLFLIGRNGMHRYNNQDHSMLAAMEAVKNITSGLKAKDNIWSVNTEDDYHEENK